LTSRWAAHTAVARYDVPPERVAVVPFGANLLPPFVSRAVVWDAIDARLTSSRCRLLFMATRWYWKRGDLVLRIAELLRERRVPVELTIVGCVPPSDCAMPPNTTIIPFLDKRLPEHRIELERILLRSTFVVIPGQVELFGISFCEANCHGVPGIGAATGGVSEVLLEHENGVTFPVEAPAQAYAQYIRDQLADPEEYRRLARGSRDAFEGRLNWDMSLASVDGHLRRILKLC